MKTPDGKYVISKTGMDLPDDEAAVYVETKVEIYCMRKDRPITVRPFFYAGVHP